MGKQVVVVDDDEKIADLISIYLKNSNLDVTTFYDSKKAFDYLNQNIPDALVLDIMMPGIDGLKMLSDLRKKCYYPILLVSARNTDRDVIGGLIQGADDYMKKPFNPTELVARVNVLIRRSDVYDSISNNVDYVIRYKDIAIDESVRKVMLKDEKIELTPSEYMILKELIVRRGTIVTSEKLFQLVTGNDYYNKSCNSVAVHIRNLRIKLKDSFENPSYIKTAWGVGYYVE